MRGIRKQMKKDNEEELIGNLEDSTSLFETSFVGKKFKQLHGSEMSIGSISDVIKDNIYDVTLQRENSGFSYRIDKRSLIKHYEEIKWIVKYFNVVFEWNSATYYSKVNQFIISMPLLFTFKLLHNWSEEEALIKIIEKKYKIKSWQFKIKEVTLSEDINPNIN